MLHTERNKRVAAEYVEAFNRGDVDRPLERFAPDAVVKGVLSRGGLDKVPTM